MKLRARPNLLDAEVEGEGNGTLLDDDPIAGEDKPDTGSVEERNSLLCAGGVCAGLDDDEL